MDHKIRLSIGEEGISTMKTERIKGKLLALIISYDSQFPASLRITSTLGYILLDTQDVTGTEYYPLRIQGKDWRGWGTMYGNYEYNLNETLNITVQGEVNTRMTIIIRTK